MGAKAKVPWGKIEREYVSADPPISYAQLGKKHGVDVSTVERRASAGKWRAKRGQECEKKREAATGAAVKVAARTAAQWEEWKTEALQRHAKGAREAHKLAVFRLKREGKTASPQDARHLLAIEATAAAEERAVLGLVTRLGPGPEGGCGAPDSVCDEVAHAFPEGPDGGDPPAGAA